MDILTKTNSWPKKRILYEKQMHLNSRWPILFQYGKILRLLEGTPACGNYLEVKWLTGSWGWSLLGRRLGWTEGLLRNKHDRRWAIRTRIIFPTGEQTSFRRAGWVVKAKMRLLGLDSTRYPVWSLLVLWFHWRFTAMNLLHFMLTPQTCHVWCPLPTPSSEGQCDSPNSDLFLLL